MEFLVTAMVVLGMILLGGLVLRRLNGQRGVRDGNLRHGSRLPNSRDTSGQRPWQSGWRGRRTSGSGRGQAGNGPLPRRPGYRGDPR